jgi:hypothetical protein
MACVIPFTQRTAMATKQLARALERDEVLHSTGKKQRGSGFSTLELGRGQRPPRSECLKCNGHGPKTQCQLPVCNTAVTISA